VGEMEGSGRQGGEQCGCTIHTGQLAVPAGELAFPNAPCKLKSVISLLSRKPRPGTTIPEPGSAQR
jgi:hypothetical protein